MKKKIKIIDLLCYTANGDFDKLPKEIMYEGEMWTFNNSSNDYFSKYNDDSLYARYCEEMCIDRFLNDEVEILDEEDEFEDIEELMEIDTRETSNCICKIQDKINDLIKNQKKIISKIERLNNERNKI